MRKVKVKTLKIKCFLPDYLKKKKMNRKHDKSLSFYHLICILHMVLTTEGFLEVAIES